AAAPVAGGAAAPVAGGAQGPGPGGSPDAGTGGAPEAQAGGASDAGPGCGSASSFPQRKGLARQIHRACLAWALFGGAVLLSVVAVNLASVVGGVFGRPFPGDFELTEIGVAVAAFAFLPWCQLTDADVSADVFTARVGARWIARFRLAGALVALLVAAVLVWRMSAGLSDQRDHGYVSAILSVPIWWAYVPILVSLALLAAAALVRALESAARS
ncbi:MAG: TRAP transporter small permease subunit, partial [Pseudomonadota bacterium]